MAHKRKQPPRPDEAEYSRRELIRKAAYSAPALVALGFTVHSKRARAQLGTPPPPPP